MNDIEYQLKFLLNSTTLAVDSIREIEGAKTELLTFFKKYGKTKIIRGFMRMESTGHYEVPMLGVSVDEKEIKHRVVYCQVAVGTPIYASMEYATTCSPPNGYDSFIVKREGGDISTVIPEFEKDGRLGHFSYILNDRSRVLSLCEVQFTYDKELEERSRNTNICEFCRETPSISFCLAERASFCGKCDGVFHANAFTQRHNRYYFDKVGKKKFIHCSAHPSNIIDYFCQECNIPICEQCRMFGSHSAAPANSHRFLSYIDACNYLGDKVAGTDPETEKILDASSKAVSVVMETLSEFQRNLKEIRDRIDLEYKAVTADLNDLGKKRYQILNAKYLELKHLQALLTQSWEYPREVDTSVLVSKWKSIQETIDLIKEIPLDGAEPEKRRLLLNGSLSVRFKSEEEDETRSVTDTSYDEEVIRKRTDLLLNVMRYHTSSAL
jgi:tripartite motif-containing protein 36